MTVRSRVGRVAEKFLVCGVLEHGFARIRCDACTHEYLLAFSCKCRYFCPSCHAKRLRAYCPYRRRLFGEIADCAVKAVTYRSDKSEGPTAGTETVDPLEFLGRVLVHIPDKGHVTTRYCGWYCNRRVHHPGVGDRPNPYAPPDPRGA